MGNRRTLNFIPLIAVLLFALAIIPFSFAYDNLTVHPALNTYAVENFIANIMPADLYLKNSELTGSAKGIAWDQTDGRDTSWSGSYSQSKAIEKEKATKQWMIDGGFSADEPETAMGLRHFFDPLREPSYLTDLGAVGSLAVTNPQMDAVTWAFDSSENQYSFEEAKTNFKNALLEKQNKNEFYGKAWRGVGETMHLIEDMTVPAHVRNDGHPPWNKEMYEGIVDAADVETYKGEVYPNLGFSVAKVDASKSVKQLMKEVATFTSNNYFSKDTIPQVGETTNANGYDLYSEPTLGVANSNGYYYRSVESYRNYLDDDPSLATSMRIAKKSRVGIVFKKDIAVIDWSVIEQQKSVQIPLAIRSAESVLDAFLPRFVVSVDNVSAYPSDPTKKMVEAHIEQIPTKEWPNPLEIQNGAHIKVGGMDYEIKVNENLYSTTSLNRIKFPVPATDADAISVYYDFGGYKIKGEYTKKVIDKSKLLITEEDVPEGYYLSKYALGSEIEDHVRQWGYLHKDTVIEGEKNGNPFYSKDGYTHVINNFVSFDWWVQDRYYNDGATDSLEGIKETITNGTLGSEVLDPTSNAPVWEGIPGADFSGMYYLDDGSKSVLSATYTAIFAKDGLIVTMTVKGASLEALSSTEEQKKETLRTQLIDMGGDPEKIKIYFEMNPTTLELTSALAQIVAEKMKTA